MGFHGRVVRGIPDRVGMVYTRLPYGARERSPSGMLNLVEGFQRIKAMSYHDGDGSGDDVPPGPVIPCDN